MKGLLPRVASVRFARLPSPHWSNSDLSRLRVMIGLPGNQSDGLMAWIMNIHNTGLHATASPYVPQLCASSEQNVGCGDVISATFLPEDSGTL